MSKQTNLFIYLSISKKFTHLGHGSISTYMHGKVNERIERITKSTCFYVCEVYCALVVTSALIQTLINYYIVGLGDDAFYLPILAVYVCTQYATSIEETYLFVLLICIFFQISIQLENTFGLFGRLDHLHFG